MKPNRENYNCAFFFFLFLVLTRALLEMPTQVARIRFYAVVKHRAVVALVYPPNANKQPKLS